MDSRLTQSKACSCSYPTTKVAAAAARQFVRNGTTSLNTSHQRSSCGAPVSRSSRSARHVCAARDSKPEPSPAPKQQTISGYTPANFISFSDKPEHRCHHLIGIEVDAPAAVCFAIWNDWNRLVEFLDLISQIGLDPDQEDFALFQCFYRWGMLPVLEIVFLLQKTSVEQDKLITFETVQGMPASGDVQFVEQNGKTTVLLKLEHQLPNLLVDLEVNVFGVETSCREIFSENLAVFKQLAEALAKSPRASVRQEAADEVPSMGFPIDELEQQEEEWAAAQAERREAEEGEEGEAGEEGEDEEEGEGEDEEQLQQQQQQEAAAAAAAPSRLEQAPSPSAPSPSRPKAQPPPPAEAAASKPAAAARRPAAAKSAAAASEAAVAVKSARTRKKAEPQPEPADAVSAPPAPAAAAAAAAAPKARGRAKGTSSKAARAG